MHNFVAKTTLALAISATVLTGCNEGSPPDEPATTAPSSASPSASASASASPSATQSSTPAAAESIVGDWSDPKAKWTVHFKDDGTFVEDFEGITDFRVGTYKVSGQTVSLIGGDGNTDKGTMEGETIEFRLGTLKRTAS